MKTIPFNKDQDLAPMPFEDRICQQALELKRLGLNWHPHVGCFVWDVDNIIQVDSPFPGNIYFILSLPRFIDIFGSIENIIAKLVWLPTWHQARLLCQQLGIPDTAIAGCLESDRHVSPGEQLLQIYELMAEAIRKD
jgi:hypothetical protein